MGHLRAKLAFNEEAGAGVSDRGSSVSEPAFPRSVDLPLLFNTSF